MTRRIFLGLAVDAWKNQLEALQADFISQHIRLIKPESFHITLVFIGMIDDQALANIIFRLKDFKFTPFEISAKQVTVLNHRHLVVEIESEKLFNYQKKFEDLLQIKTERKYFPHITLGKILDPADKPRDANLPKGKLHINHFYLYESLGKNTYIKLEKF